LYRPSKKLKKRFLKKQKPFSLLIFLVYHCDIKKIQKIIKNKNIKILSDSAQTPYFPIYGKLAGTLFDVGGYSSKLS
jgi:Predicted pyridoxal phosphate-dependent enzyme apparently involved in regulation of cell wall biogenesis